MKAFMLPMITKIHPISILFAALFILPTIANNSGYINADRVYLRSDHSTKASVLLMMDRGQSVEIINNYRPSSNFDEAILRYQTNFYSQSTGAFLFYLSKGKAVKIVRKDGSDYYVSFRNDQTGATGYSTISGDRLEFIGGDVWYYVGIIGQIDPFPSASN
jgi:hypothetical protein